MKVLRSDTLRSLLKGHPWVEFLFLSLTGACVYGWVALYSMQSSGFSDSIEYLFMADFYRGWFFGEPIADRVGHYGTTRYPPLFPVTLAVFGAGSDHQDLANLVSGALAMIAPLCIWFWIKKEGFHSLHATWIALALLLYPAFFLINLNVVSEPLAIALLSLGLIGLGDGKVSNSRLLTASLVLGAASLARMALIPIVPALAIWLGFRRDVALRVKVLAVTISGAPSVAWLIYRSALKSETYVDALNFSKMMALAGGWPGALWTLPCRLFKAIVDNWESGFGIASLFPSVVLIILGISGCLLRLKQNKLDAWFLAGYIAMILLWPYPDELGRFIVIVYGGILLCAVHAAIAFDQRLAYWSSKAPIALTQLFLAGVIGMASLTTFASFASRAAVEVDAELLGEKREAFFFRAESDRVAQTGAEVFGRARLLAESLSDHVPADDCVYAVFPEFVRLHGGIASFSYPSGLSDAAIAKDQLTRCNYYFIAGFGTLQTQMPKLYPMNALAGWTSPVLASMIINENGEHIAAALLTRGNQDMSDSTSH